MPNLARSFEAGVEATVAWSVHRSRTVLAAFLVAVLVAAPGVFQLDVHNRMTDWVDPAGEEEAAFLEAVQVFEGLVDFERSLLTYQGDHPDGLLSPESLREQEALVDAVAARTPALTGHFSALRFVQLAAYEASKARGQDAEARLPSDDAELAAAIALARETQASAIGYTLTEDLRRGYIGFTFDTPPFTPEATKVGGTIAQAIAAYYATAPRTLADEATAPVGVASVSAHIDGVLYQDMVLLGGAGLLLVAGLFWLSARHTAWVIGGFGALAGGLVIIVGTLGWFNVPFNVLNFAVLPLILGNGIDYMIHVLAETGTDKRRFGKGLGNHLGKALGVPIVLVTLTTMAGLGSLGFSQSPYLRQMGILGAASVALIAVLSLTVLPAWLSLSDSKHRRVRPGRTGAIFAASARFGTKHPWLLALIVAAPTVAGAVAFANTEYRVDLLAGGLPEDDPRIVAQELFEQEFATDDAWFILMQGDVVSEDAWAFQDRLRAALTERGLVAGDAIYDLPRLANGYHDQQDPARGLLAGTGFEPPTREATPEEKVAAMQADPAYADLLSPLLDDGRGALYFTPLPSERTLKDTDVASRAFEQAVEDAEPGELTVHVYSFKRLARDFMAESQQSLQVLYFVSLASTAVLFYGVTRDGRATLIVALPVVLSSLWWFGLLKVFLGSVGVYQLISLVFITSLGSDYAAYLVYKVRSNGLDGLSSTGRAVLFSAITDAGAFLVFSLTQVRSGGQMLVGAALAVLAVLLATLAVVPPLLARAGRAPRAKLP